MKVKVYSFWKYNTFTNEYRLCLWEFRPPGEGFLDVREHEVDLDIPKLDESSFIDHKKNELLREQEKLEGSLKDCKLKLAALGVQNA